MFNADDRLSRAASEIWRSWENECRDYDMDGSGELGGMIASLHQAHRVAAVRLYGFTPDEYNAELRRRLCGDEYPRMSYRIYMLLGMLEVESMEGWLDDNTFIDTGCGEQSSISYLKGA